ncbi:MAG TPA: sigma-70 family RNA polymerase sigma factor [Polyangiaceae bacterium]|nr:sigma-70 family RNA polymerase sigma factor [Polyangiaceae bacterium]
MGTTPDRASLPSAALLFERYGAMVHRRCRDILGRDEAALDAMQDVFLRVLEKGHLFRGESAPSTWLYAMATLQCLQRLRDRTSHQAKLDVLAAATRAALGSPVEDRLSLRALLERQPEDVRLIVYLRYVDEMTMEEVAEIVGYSRRTVSQRVHEFLEAARQQLQAEGATP